MKIQDNYADGKILWFNDFYLEDDRMFFSAGNFNALYEFLIKEDKLQFLGTFKDENLLCKQLYGKIHRYKDKLIFTPLSAENIAIYDLKNKEFKAIPLPSPKIPCGFEGKFLNSVLLDNRLLMFPGRFYCVVEYNLDSDEVLVHDDWYNKCVKRWGKRSYLLFSYDMVKVGENIFLPSALNSGVFQYCLNENKYDFIDVICECKNLSTLAYDEEHFWSTTDDGKLLIMKDNGTIIECIDIYAVYGECGPFYRSIYEDGYLWLFLSQKSKIIKINCDNYIGEYEVLEFSEEEKTYSNLEYHTVNFVERKNGKIIFMSRANRELLYINNRTVNKYMDHIADTSMYSEKEVKEIDLYKINVEYANKKNLYFHEQNNVILHEKTSSADSLGFLLEEVDRKKSGEDNKDNSHSGKKVGESVYENCCN